MCKFIFTMINYCSTFPWRHLNVCQHITKMSHPAIKKIFWRSITYAALKSSMWVTLITTPKKWFIQHPVRKIMHVCEMFSNKIIEKKIPNNGCTKWTLLSRIGLWIQPKHWRLNARSICYILKLLVTSDNLMRSKHRVISMF